MPSSRIFTLGPDVPRRGNTFSHLCGLFLLWLIGWRMRGDFPNVRKGMVIVAPHTSNYDGVVAVAAILALRLQLLFFVKDSAFVWPIGGLMKWFGARPVDRENSKDLVGYTVRQYAANDSLMLAIAPEGTRKASPAWKTGFYWMAYQAGVPIIMIAFDYSKKEIVVLGCFTPTGNVEQDLPLIIEHFRGMEPCHEERLSAPLRALREKR
ncbi:MAG TPA: 1-acyl-sn-glycerol-3-phosphate acyltransferase [Candidatus Kapabacteria bacterium]|nr:1-acyl-sn-glycerol-3-phosphate acyltransferase [Candidatus Kapabacteria bacterium]